MSMILPTLIILSLISVVAVMVLGIYAMAKGGDFNEKHGNKLMRLRVILQGLTIFLLLASLFFSQG